MRVAVADYGAGNLRSLSSALVRAGVHPVVTVDPDVVREAPLALIAGVGHVRAPPPGSRATASTTRSATASRQSVPSRGSASECSSSSKRARRVEPGLASWRTRSPRAGASRPAHGLEHARRHAAEQDSRRRDGADVYFAHSFAVEPEDDAVVAATVDHGGPVVAAVESGSLAGVQFHPERSAAAGARVLENLARWSRNA